MSQIARVFVVLNLVIAAGFLFAAATFLGTKAHHLQEIEDLKTARQNDLAANQRMSEKATTTIQELTSANSALKEEKARADERSVQLKARVEGLDAENATKNTQIAGLTADIASSADATKRGQDEIKRLGDKNTELVAAVAAAQKAEQDAKGGETTAKSTIIERDNAIMALEKTKKSLEDLNHEKALVIEWARGQGVDLGAAIKMEPVDARVIAVDMKLKLVQFNVGSKQGVAKGYTIDVVRGNTYVGRVRIDQVYGDNSAGTLTIATPGQTPAVGDRGTNTLL